MFTHKDIQHKSIFVINGTEHKKLKVSAGRILMQNTETNSIITILPAPKILVILIVGHTTITTPLIELCGKYAIPIVVMKPNFRPLFYFGNMADANYLLRQKQYECIKGNLNASKAILKNKIDNQYNLIKKTLEKDSSIDLFYQNYKSYIHLIDETDDIRALMGIEGNFSKLFFQSYFKFANWNSRLPRVKLDYLNATLDIGYTMLFNYIESMTRLFGFDPYIGIYHQLWFKRKSLVCDLIEPFRCIIDHQIRKSIKYGTFTENDFILINNAYLLRYDERVKYTKIFFEAIIKYKSEIFKYLQQYYRCFMGRKSVKSYPKFNYE
jgi:CRISP-associated protein Cas1